MPRLRPHRPVRVGIAGGLASGKSTVLAEFKKAGWATLSADEVVHRLYKKKDLKLSELRKAAQKSERAIRALERLIHPLVGKEIRKFLKERKKPCCVEIPLLFEGGWEKAFDKTIFVYCPTLFRKQRALRRGMSEKLFTKLDNRQMKSSEKARRSDFVLQNREQKKLLRLQAKHLTKLLLEMAKA